MGAALQQKELGGWRPLAFFSAKLSATQQRYSAFDRELLGVFFALRHFRFELEGQKFHILTDHLPLVSALSCVSPPWSAHQQRQLSYISEFTSDLRHTPGAANVVADNHSRPPPKSPPALQLPPSPGVKVSEVSVSTTPSPFPTSSVINFSELAKEQLFCPPVQDGLLLCDAKTKVLRPLVSSSQRFNICSALHLFLEFKHPDILFLQGLSGGA